MVHGATKKKSRKVMESFRQGQMAECEINRSIKYHISAYSNGCILQSQMFEIGLLQSMECQVAAVSPDGISIFRCYVDNHRDSVEAKDSRKLAKFLDENEYVVSSRVHTANQGSSSESLDAESDVIHDLVCCLEDKHKSAAITIADARKIVSADLNGKRFRVLHLGHDEDIALFHKAIPDVGYRSQVIHEAVTTGLLITLFTVGTTCIEYMLMVLVPDTIYRTYVDVMCFIKREHLSFLFKENDVHDEESSWQQFDKELVNFPKFNNISWGYADGPDTVKCRLQIMMSLYELRRQIGYPLPACLALVPLVVKRWNSGKGAIDDLSKTLAHNLARFGPLNPVCVLWIRMLSTKLYNAWRLWSLQECRTYVLSEHCNTHAKFLHERQRLGRTFEEFLRRAFCELRLPPLLPFEPASQQCVVAHSSPTSRPVKKQRVSHDEWNTTEVWIDFRLKNNDDHIGTSMEKLLEAGKIERERRGAETEHHDMRRYCRYCSYVVRDEPRTQPKHLSYFEGQKARKTSNFCTHCLVALCNRKPTDNGMFAHLTCFQRWHKVRRLPSVHGHEGDMMCHPSTTGKENSENS
jgi:hypothetical protein